jgi:hypothetical protein
MKGNPATLGNARVSSVPAESFILHHAFEGKQQQTRPLAWQTPIGKL